MNDLQVFDFDGRFRVRVTDQNGSPWFVAKDVCEALEIKNASDAISRLDQDERSTIGNSESRNGGGSLLILSESGLYALILRCQGAMTDGTPAHRFRKWVTAEVLPAIRRGELINVPRSLSEALRLAADLEDKRVALEAKIAADAPKVELAEAIGKTERAMSITDAAKHFGLHPKLEVFPYFRALGYLTQADLPTQAAIDQGYLSLKQTKDREGNIWPQAVVEVWQLETWRSRVVPQIKRWAKSQEIPA